MSVRVTGSIQLRQECFSDTAGQELTEIVTLYTRPAQAQARQNLSARVGSRHKVPPLAKKPLENDG